MNREEVVIIGGGPCGLSAAIAIKEAGLQPLVIEKGNVVNAIYQYPTHQTFFSSSEKLEIGNVPFIIDQRKPSRNQALAYYREVVKRKNVRINAFEKVTGVSKDKELYIVHTSKNSYFTKYIIIATGYYDNPNFIGVPGEELGKVSHYFKEAHPYFDKDVVVIGGKNSAVDAALELHKAGARVTVIYRGREYSDSIKPWILPEFDSLVRNGHVKMIFNAEVSRITEQDVTYNSQGKETTITNDFVFAMTGYKPDHSFLTKLDIKIDKESGRPHFNPETMETNMKNIFIAGVIAAGNNANEIFIENGRFHGDKIAENLKKRKSDG